MQNSLRHFHLLLLATFMGVSMGAYAENDLDKDDITALEQTQDLLRNISERQKFIDSNTKAKQADNYTKSLSGNNPDAVNDIYALAAEVFALMVKEANGDAKKISQALEGYSRNPAALAQKLTPEMKAKLRGISFKLPQSGPSQK